MSIDYYSCSYCGDTFNDCGEYISCDCGNMWCSEKCAKRDGYKYNKRTGDSTCKYCREEDFTDDKLLKFALKMLDKTRRELVIDYKNSKK